MIHLATKYDMMHEKRRTQILASAKALILKRDIAATTMRDIAKDCDISRQTLYKYFVSLDDIIYAIQADIFQESSVYFHPQDTCTSVLDLFVYGIDCLYQYYQEHEDDFIFTCLFDTYVRAHHSKEYASQRYYRFLIANSPIIQKIFSMHPNQQDEICGVKRETFSALIEIGLALFARMAILGDNFSCDGLLTKKQLVDIYKDMVITYLQNKQIQSGR